MIIQLIERTGSFSDTAEQYVVILFLLKQINSWLFPVK